MNYPAILFAFILPFSLSMAEEEKATTNPLLLSLEQYKKIKKAPVDMVTASHEKDQWKFSILPNRSEINFSQELKKVVLIGDGFEIPVAAGSIFGNLERAKFTITAKMRESAVLEIWMLTSHQGGSRAEHFTIKLAEISPKSEQVVAPNGP